jgi:hypothetical protein
LVAYRQQLQFRLTSGMNILVMLLLLFVVTTHCASAMAIEMEPTTASIAAYEGVVHCDDNKAPGDLDTDPCFDDQCLSTFTGLQSKPVKQTISDDYEPLSLAVIPAYLPFSRAGPCRVEAFPTLPDFTSPSLIYSLCVLRL